MPTDDDIELDLAAALAADEDASQQMLVLYIPDRDRDGNEIGDQRRWALEAATLLAEIGGGVTINPPVEGGWLNEVTNTIIWERPVIIYSYIRPERFRTALPRLRRFLHDMGRKTNQGEVAIEFDGVFFRIREFEVI